MNAPCDGLVWFRGFRPSRQHQWVDMVVVFNKSNWRTCMVLSKDAFVAGQWSEEFKQFIGGNDWFWRETLSECARCGEKEFASATKRKIRKWSSWF